jgi:hypothetical protein
VEGDIDARERNSGETTLEDNIALSLLFLKCAVIAAVHDILQHLLDLSEAKFLSQLVENRKYNNSSQLSNDAYLGYVNLLHLEVIKNVR